MWDSRARYSDVRDVGHSEYSYLLYLKVPRLTSESLFQFTLLSHILASTWCMMWFSIFAFNVGMMEYYNIILTFVFYSSVTLRTFPNYVDTQVCTFMNFLFIYFW